MSDAKVPGTKPCRACGKPMAFVQSATSRQMIPIDPTPVPNGNIVLEVRGGQTVAVHKPLGPDDGVAAGPDDGTPPCYLSHFATCTSPADFRRRKRR